MLLKCVRKSFFFGQWTLSLDFINMTYRAQQKSSKPRATPIILLPPNSHDNPLQHQSNEVLVNIVIPNGLRVIFVIFLCGGIHSYHIVRRWSNASFCANIFVNNPELLGVLALVTHQRVSPGTHQGPWGGSYFLCPWVNDSHPHEVPSTCPTSKNILPLLILIKDSCPG